ncbi:hypothetical protein AC249_AIPGENE20408 [Exaiptasia diaphana]|nr:hypothetical protein AC249_AIPGENE20408 [Exaiptasia diaphana]
MNVEVVSVSEYIEGHKFISLETITCYPLKIKDFIYYYFIYLNGSLDKNETGTSPTRNMILYAPNNYWIGKVGFTDQNYFNGWMKNQLMIPRVLQDSEMKALAGERVVYVAGKSAIYIQCRVGREDKCRQEKPCRNGGQCIYYEDIHDYRCVCAQGTTGKDCEILEKFGIKESYLVKLALDGKDASLTPINGAKYENTDQGKALYLDGVNDFVLVPRFVFYDKNYTFGVWVKLAAFKRHSIISDDDGHNGRRSFNFRIGPGNKAMVVMYFGDGSTAISSTSNGIIPINQWTHIGATFDIDAHRVKIYLNGTLDKNHVGRSSVRNMCLYDTTSYWIGKVGYTNEDFFKGWMKDLSMISRVLQDSEMKALSDGERRAWIGLNDKANEGVLQWADESPMTYKNMKQLNTETRDCSAAILVENFPEEWSMRDCQEESFFICRK